METYKIAAVTEDDETISRHFGMAPRYRVFTVADGVVQSEESREKAHHTQHPSHEDGNHSHSNLHDDMFAPIRDCRVLLAGGMGRPAFEKAQAVGLEVVLATGNLREMVQAYLDGRLISDNRRVH